VPKSLGKASVINHRLNLLKAAALLGSRQKRIVKILGIRSGKSVDIAPFDGVINEALC